METIGQILRTYKPQPPLERYVYKRHGDEQHALQTAARQYIPGFVVDKAIQPHVSTLIAWALCDDTAAKAINPADGRTVSASMFRGYYIAGPTGSGKTSLLTALDSWLQTRGFQFATYGQDRALILPRFNAKDLCRSYRQKGDSALDLAHRLPIILLDDIGADESESMYMGSRVDVIAELILARADNPACLTWYTSNLPLMPPSHTDGNPLLDRYGARVVSRLIGTTNYLTLIADDRRLKGGQP